MLPWPGDRHDAHQHLVCSAQVSARFVLRPCKVERAVVQEHLHLSMLCEWCWLLQGTGCAFSCTFCAGALHRWLLHQVAPRVAAPCAGAGSSIVRDDWYLGHRGLALSGANRLCRGHLQKWGLLWLCFLSSTQVVPVTATTVKPLPHLQRGKLQQANCSWVRADAGS